MSSAEYRLTIKEMNADDRPRERLARYGPSALSNAELLAIIIQTGTAKGTALDLASALLSGKELTSSAAGDGNPLLDLAEAKIEELCRIKGIGAAKAIMIQAALELGRRSSTLVTGQRFTVKSPEDVSLLVMDEMRRLDREHFKVFLLNTKNQVIGVELVSMGSLNSTIVHPREVFKNPIKRSAAALILVHNHPSGDPTPSREDIELTKRLAEAGSLLGINVLDHIIIGDNRFVSLKERKLF